MTNEELNSFHESGYLLVKQALSSETLSVWKKNAQFLESSLKPGTSINTFFSSPNEVGRVNDLMRYFPGDVLSLLASEPIMEIAYDFCGENAVPLSCDLLIKRTGSSSIIDWHQDVVHSRDYPFIVIGIYLDDSNLNDGPLRIIKGSHFEKQNIPQVKQSSSTHDVPAKSGDIIVHDAMILHRSGMKKRSGARRTIYVEMRPFEAIIADNFQSKKWADLRKTWMEFVLEKANGTWKSKFRRSCDHSTTNIEQFVSELLNEYSPYPPAHYG